MAENVFVKLNITYPYYLTIFYIWVPCTDNKIMLAKWPKQGTENQYRYKMCGYMKFSYYFNLWLLKYLNVYKICCGYLKKWFVWVLCMIQFKCLSFHWGRKSWLLTLIVRLSVLCFSSSRHVGWSAVWGFLAFPTFWFYTLKCLLISTLIICCQELPLTIKFVIWLQRILSPDWPNLSS